MKLNLKRYGDSNSFLGDIAASAFLRMIEHVSPQRTLTGLLSVIDSKTAEVRGKVTSLVCHLVNTKGAELSGSRELIDGLMKYKLEKVLSDKDPEARLYAREILELIIQKKLVGSYKDLEQYISPSILEKSLKERSRDKLKDTCSPKGTPTRGNASPSRKRLSPSRLQITAGGSDKPCDFLPSPGKVASITYSIEEEDTSILPVSRGNILNVATPEIRSSRPNGSKGFSAKQEMESLPELQALPDVMNPNLS